MSAKDRVLSMPFEGLRELPWDKSDPWSAVRYAANYAPGPLPVPLTDDHRAWFKGLEERLWQTMSPDKFGHRGVVEKRGSLLDQEDVHKMFRLTREHRLATSLHMATFGFTGFTLCFHEFRDETYPGVGCEGTYLASISDDHLPGFPDHEDRDDRLQFAWELFSAFAHSEENLCMLRLLKVRDMPGDRDCYVY